MFWEEEKRVNLPSKTKREVYERAQKRCQSCGRPLKINQGDFHHLRKPTVKSRPSTVQFLCPTCHKAYGHEWKTRTVTELFETRKVSTIVRKKVRKHPSSPYWKEKTKKTLPRKKKTRKKKTTRKTTKTRRRRRKKR